MKYIDGLVSIIMPVHNSAKTISESIDSVLAQTYRNWELLIVNDCSTDTSVSIIDTYLRKDSRIKLFHTDISFGKPFYPRNLALKNAKGRFVAFLDSDDVWLPLKLEKQIPLFEDRNVAIVFSNYVKFDNSSNNNFNRKIISAKKLTYKSAIYGNQIGNLTGVYDVSKVGKVEFLNEGHEDYILWLMILKKGFIAKNTNSIEAKYRVLSGSISSNKGRSSKWTWHIYRRILKLNFLKSLYFYMIYAVRGLFKYLK